MIFTVSVPVRKKNKFKKKTNLVPVFGSDNYK